MKNIVEAPSKNAPVLETTFPKVKPSLAIIAFYAKAVVVKLKTL